MTTEITTIVLGFLACFVPLCALAWSAFRFVAERKRSNDLAEYDKVHELVRIIYDIDPQPLASQVAAAFELRHFPRYHKLLINLRKYVSYKSSDEKAKSSREKARSLEKQLDETIADLESRK